MTAFYAWLNGSLSSGQMSKAMAFEKILSQVSEDPISNYAKLLIWYNIIYIYIYNYAYIIYISIYIPI